MTIESGESVITGIRKNLRLLQAVIGFIVSTLFAVILRYHFEPLRDILGFLPKISIDFIIAIIFMLVLIGFYISMTVSRHTINSISEYSSKLDQVLNITRDLREEIYGDILLNKIMDYSVSLTRSDAGAILLLDKDNLVFKIVRGDKSPDLSGTSMSKHKGAAGWVIENSKPLVISDTKNDKRFAPETDSLTGDETKSLLCVPLSTKTGVIGILELISRNNDFFTQNDVEIIAYLADQAAVSIATAKFYEDQKNYEIHLTDMLLESIDFQIPEKMGHSRRVAKYSNIIARALDMPEGERKKLYFACLLHDVGFLKIRPTVNSMPEEYRRHPAIGYEMITPISFYTDIAPHILYHHERYDGKGYPTGIRGEDIPLQSRIIAVTEAFDAMISNTSYKAAMSFDKALAELQKHAGTQFDPRLVKVFIENIDPIHIK